MVQLSKLTCTELASGFLSFLMEASQQSYAVDTGIVFTD